jgi:cytochrome c553
MDSIRILCAAGAIAVASTTAAQQPAAAAGNPEAARAHISMCTGCHTIPGYQASFPRVYRVPKIGGQSAKYIEAALQGYKKGERDHPTMQAIAKGLTDQQIADIAAYYAARGAEAAK